jgi:shikimate dehydrogenase
MIRPEQKKLFAVVGNPVRHSLSPAMMSAAFETMGVQAVYAALFVNELARDLETLHRAGFSGLSVTIPYKETACRLAVVKQKTAYEIGAVNTLRRSSNGWEGRNTDWIGAVRALSQAGAIEGRNALVLGAGGAARAVAYGLQRAGAEVTIANRCAERGKSLSHQLHCRFIALNVLEKKENNFNLVVQCTSLGLAGAEQSSPVSASFFRPEMLVMEIVYRPRHTVFSRAAEQAGCTVVSGLDMLLYQGVAQIEWWLESAVTPPAVEAMRRALERAAGDE